MKTIKIPTEGIACTLDEATRYVSVLNGIVYDCQDGGFMQGWRNSIAVNLTVALTMLGMPVIDTFDTLVEEGVIDPKADDENTYDRLYRVMRYDASFGWDYMLDPENWELGEDLASGLLKGRSNMKIWFELD